MQDTSVMCIAHRGFSALYPENTFSAFEAALRTPIFGIETDLQLTLDEVPVVYHDRSLKMVGGGLRLMRTRRLEQAQQLDYGAWFGAEYGQQALPTLKELLDRLGHATQWLLEIKRRELPWKRERLELLMRKTIQLVRERGLADRVMILCYDLELLAYGHGLDAGLRYVWNQDQAEMATGGDFLYAYSLQHKAVSAALVARIQKTGKRVFTFTVDDGALLQRVLACGVNGVMANNPQWLAEQLGSCSAVTDQPTRKQ